MTGKAHPMTGRDGMRDEAVRAELERIDPENELVSMWELMLIPKGYTKYVLRLLVKSQQALRQIQDYCDLGLVLFLKSNRFEHLVKLVDNILGGETVEDRWGKPRQTPERREIMKLDLSEQTKKELTLKKEKLKIELTKLEGTRDALEDEIEILSKLSAAVKTIIDNHDAGEL